MAWKGDRWLGRGVCGVSCGWVDESILCLERGGRSVICIRVSARSQGEGGGNPAVVEWFMDGCGFLTRMTELVGVTVSGPTIYLGGGRQYHWIGYFGETSTAFHGRFHDGWISP